MRTIGIVRARAKIGLQNLVYNIRRLVTLEVWLWRNNQPLGPGTERSADMLEKRQSQITPQQFAVYPRGRSSCRKALIVRGAPSCIGWNGVMHVDVELGPLWA